MLKDRKKDCGRALGRARPAVPVPIYAEDFSELCCSKSRDRLRHERGRIVTVPLIGTGFLLAALTALAAGFLMALS